MPDVIDKVISFISGDGDNASDKDVLLKQLAREISQNKHAKFYRVRQGEADVSLAQYFFNIYRIIYPMQTFFSDSGKEEKIGQITLEAYLDKHVMDVIKKLSADTIAERKRNSEPDLSKHLQEDLAALAVGFDSPKISAADKCYNLIYSIKQFVRFDFYSLLQLFDPDIKEGDFLTVPKFSPVDATLLASSISVFLSLLPPDDEDNDWKTAFEILKYCNGGTDVIPLHMWESLLLNLKDVKESSIFELIDKLITGNPILKIKTIVPNEILSARWLEHKTHEIREVITGIAGSQRNAQIKAVENTVFGSIVTIRLNYYLPEKGKVLLDKDLDSFTYAPALNHLFTFIQEYFSKELQELCDILLVRGQWTNNHASRQMSDGFHDVVGISGEITKLDESMSDEGSNGSRLRASLLRVDRDKSQARYINSIIGSINEEALHLINRAVSSLITVGKHFKMLMDDCEKKPTELIANWKELFLVSKTPITQSIASAYKKINYFVQLMLLETKPLEE